MKIIGYLTSISILQMILRSTLQQTKWTAENVCPVNKCAKCNMADGALTCDDCYYTLKNLQDGSTPNNYFCQGPYDLDNCLELQLSIGQSNTSDPRKCLQCMPGYEMTTDQTYQCNIMKVKNCWYNANNQHNSTLSVDQLYANREKLGLFSFFEQTRLQEKNLLALGYKLPDGQGSVTPCIVCGPGFLASRDGQTCDPITSEEKVYACSLHYRDYEELDVIRCLLCINHYFLTVAPDGTTSCGYDRKKSQCVDPSNMDANGNCVKCDPINGNFAVGVSLDSSGSVIGNICQYSRLNDMLRKTYWEEIVYFFIKVFIGIIVLMIVICCIISNRTMKAPKGHSRIKVDTISVQNDPFDNNNLQSEYQNQNEQQQNNDDE